MANFSAAADLLSSSFEKREREDGSSYWALRSGSPEWLRSAVMLAHEDEMPSDSRYELIRSAALALSESSFSDEEDAREMMPPIELTPLVLSTIADCMERWSK